MRKLFGTDGIRGVANVHPMTTEVALQLGKGCAHIFKDKHRRHKIVVGKDTRLSGYMLETAITAGICSLGGECFWSARCRPRDRLFDSSMRADAGIVISASHNPFQDNGIKIFSGNGFKLPDQLEEIEDLILSEDLGGLRVTASKWGKPTGLTTLWPVHCVLEKYLSPRNCPWTACISWWMRPRGHL